MREVIPSALGIVCKPALRKIVLSQQLLQALWYRLRVLRST